MYKMKNELPHNYIDSAILKEPNNSDLTMIVNFLQHLKCPSQGCFALQGYLTIQVPSLLFFVIFKTFYMWLKHADYSVWVVQGAGGDRVSSCFSSMWAVALTTFVPILGQTVVTWLSWRSVLCTVQLNDHVRS